MSTSKPISTKTLAKAAEGPHAHWGFRHMDSEGVRFHRLQKLVGEKNPDERAMRVLIRQIRTFAGYEAFAVCDVHIRRHPDVEAGIERTKGVFVAARDEGYFAKISESLGVLRRAASPAALEVLDEKASMKRFLSAFRKGVEDRQDFDRRGPSAVRAVEHDEPTMLSMAA